MARMLEKRGVLNGAAWLALAALFVKFMGLMYKIPLAYILTDEGMGYYNAAYTIYSLLYLLGSAGVPKALTVMISGCMTDNERKKQKIFMVARRFFTAFGFFLFLILLLLSHRISFWIGSPDSYPTILMICPCLLFVSITGVYRGYLTAEGDFSSTAVASILEACSKLVFGILFVKLAQMFGLPLPWISAFAVLGICAGAFLSVLYLNISIKNKNKGYIKEQFSKSEKIKIIKSILYIAIPITLGSLAAGISSLIDLSMIMKRLEIGGLSIKEATAVYGNYTALAVPMLQLSNALLAPVSVVLLPRLVSAYAKKDREEYASVLRFGGEVSAFLSVPLAAIFFFLPEQLLCIIFPKASAQSAAPLLRILAVGVIFLAVLFIVNSALESIGAAKMQMLSMLIGILVKIPVSYFLLSDSIYGIKGAPIGTVASYAVSFLFSYFCFSKFCGNSEGLLASYRLPCFNTFISLLLSFFTAYFLRDMKIERVKCMLLLVAFGIAYITLSYFTGALRFLKNENVAKGTKGIA